MMSLRTRALAAGRVSACPSLTHIYLLSLPPLIQCMLSIHRLYCKCISIHLYRIKLSTLCVTLELLMQVLSISCGAINIDRSLSCFPARTHTPPFAHTTPRTHHASYPIPHSRLTSVSYRHGPAAPLLLRATTATTTTTSCSCASSTRATTASPGRHIQRLVTLTSRLRQVILVRSLELDLDHSLAGSSNHGTRYLSPSPSPSRSSSTSLIPSAPLE